jgi:hypothetical protein
VDSLGDILARGLIHEALVGTMTRRNAPTTRETEAYRTALARRGPLRDAVVAVMDAERLDALAYPTLRRPPTRIGEAQPGSTCSLSANTGLPAMSIPAGFVAGGLPVAVELLGRPLADARLVSLAYAYEQAVSPRRPPSTTPPLVGGQRPAALRLTLEATGAQMEPPVTSGVRASARIVFDRAARTLDYDVEVSGVRSEDVHGVVVRRRVSGENVVAPWQVVEVLAGPGLLGASGSWALTPTLLERLDGGELYLEVFTRANPAGAARVRIQLPAQR